MLWRQERLAGEEWGAVLMALLGTLGLGVSSEEAAQPGFSLGKTALVTLGFLALLAGLMYGFRLTALQKRKVVADARATASVRGLQVVLDSKTLLDFILPLRNSLSRVWISCIGCSRVLKV